MPTPIDTLVLNRGSLTYSQYFVNYGSAWSCGYNNVGQLGIGHATSDVSTPTAQPDHDWVMISGTYMAAGGVRTDGTLWTCGQYTAPTVLGFVAGAHVTSFTQVGSATDWASVTFGENTGYGIKAGTGALWAWGTGNTGQFGNGLATSSDTPVSCGVSNVVQVAGGSLFAVLLKSDGTIHSTGSNNKGQLGLGHTTSPITSWTQIGSNTTWAQIACGSDFCLAVRTDGTLWAWGYGAQYATGFGSTSNVLSPTQVGTDTDWAEVWCGQLHTIARKTTGAIYSWGHGVAGKLGHGDELTKTVPTQIGSATNWVAVAAAGSASYARTADALYATGNNGFGSLGLGDTAPRLVLSELTFDFVSPNAPINIADSASFAVTTDTKLRGFTLADSALSADALVYDTFTWYVEATNLSVLLTSMSDTSSGVGDVALLSDAVCQAFGQMVAETAAGTDVQVSGAVAFLLSVADLTSSQTPAQTSVQILAEAIATLELLNLIGSEDVADTMAATGLYSSRVAALQAELEAIQATETNSGELHVFQLASDSVATADAGKSLGSLISALLSDTALTTIRLNIGGELFTGWVLNTDTMAPSEYQFADRQFNSACKHGDTYLMAAEDGIYEFTEDTGVESVMTYIKTGKTDFGSDLKKRIVNSYIVYSATGNMVLKVTTSEYGQLQTRNYKMVPPSNSETTDVRRVDIGRGIKSRYWQFELVGDGVDCDIDEIGMLPIVLSRRI